MGPALIRRACALSISVEAKENGMKQKAEMESAPTEPDTSKLDGIRCEGGGVRWKIWNAIQLHERRWRVRLSAVKPAHRLTLQCA